MHAVVLPTRKSLAARVTTCGGLLCARQSRESWEGKVDALDSHRTNPIEYRESGVGAGRVEYTQGGWGGHREGEVGTGRVGWAQRG